MQLPQYGVLWTLALWWTASVTAKNHTTYPTKSGIRTWVDLDTPEDKYVYTSSRGRRWDLVMSDEFNVANRSFRAGDDHMWTSLENPDGGGMLEVRAQLPGATGADSGNPDVAKGNNGKVENTRYYPTWPGIWMLGNLGRAICSASTNRMWPYSYNECDADVFDSSFQRISACESNPGYGLNPNQGRGAPEIDVLKGGGLAISSSLQIAPGMPDDCRLFPVDTSTGDYSYCLYAYNCFLDYQVEWVTGENGYVRWMLHGEPLFEVTTEAIVNVPQNKNKTNPQKIMIEEPLYIIFNVALSSSWSATHPNPGKECRGDGKDEVTNKICDAFPMYMKIDYIRLYQDLADDLEADNYMQVGCDPASHPTKEWIEGHIDEYEDDDNKWEEVVGKAFCKTSDDCTIGGRSIGWTTLKTGKCVNQRCECLYHSWGGPRCTTAISGSSSTETGTMSRTYGPPMEASISLAVAVIILSVGSVYMAAVKSAKKTKVVMAAMAEEGKVATAGETAVSIDSNRGSHLAAVSNDNYRQNFV
ncbi:hypothetical protein ON010_g7740 [Phytophthora cinnamomi]|nr:hypothetical protein ON010_g7740 [Phytophthora cinnamomi]